MKKEKTPSLVIIAIVTTLTILFWVAFGALRAFTKKEAPAIDSRLLAPLPASLNLKNLDKLEQRVYFEESQIGETIIEEGLETPAEAESP